MNLVKFSRIADVALSIVLLALAAAYFWVWDNSTYALALAGSGVLSGLSAVFVPSRWLAKKVFLSGLSR